MSPLDQPSILSTTAIVGDSTVDRAYISIVQSGWHIWRKFDRYLPKGEYGEDISLILLEFYVQGSHDWFTIPDKIKIGRYSSKKRGVSIKIPMLKDVSNAILFE